MAIALVAVDDTLVEVIPVPLLLIKVLVGLLLLLSVSAFWHFLHHTVRIQAETQFLPLAYLIYAALVFVLTCLMVPLQWAVLLFGLALGVSLLLQH